MNNGSKPLIHLEDVTKVFLTDEVETHALSGIHLDIRDGEYVSIAGPSGCGKSTLLSILGLLDTPSGGSYSLKGSEVANLSFPERARIRNREIGFSAIPWSVGGPGGNGYRQSGSLSASRHPWRSSAVDFAATIAALALPASRADLTFAASRSCERQIQSSVPTNRA